MISKVIQALLVLNGKSQKSLIGVLPVSTRQAVNQKFSRSSWSAIDLIKIADFLKCRIAVVDKNDQVVLKFPTAEEIEQNKTNNQA